MSDSQDEADRLQAAQDLLKSGTPADFVAAVKRASVRGVEVYTNCLYGGVFPHNCSVCGERKPTDPCPHCGRPDPAICLKGEDPQSYARTPPLELGCRVRTRAELVCTDFHGYEDIRQTSTLGVIEFVIQGEEHIGGMYWVKYEGGWLSAPFRRDELEVVTQ